MSDDVRNLAGLVRRAARTHPDKAALRAGTSVLSWRELDAAVDSVAAGPRDPGRPPGDRGGLLMPNTVEFATAYFATLRAGLVALPLNTAYTDAELAYQLADAGAALVLCDRTHAGLLGDVASVVTGSEEWESLSSPGRSTE